MAIARDSVTDGGVLGAAASLTFSHTCTGSDRLLVVTAFGDTNVDNITGVTYSGAAMTLVGKVNAFGAVDRWAYMFYQLAPATGANNVVVSASSASYALAAHALSYTGVLALDASATPTAASSSITASLTTIADNAWVIGGFRTGTVSATPSTGANQQVASNGLYSADSNGPKTPAGSYSMTYTNGVFWNTVLASFSPVVGGGGGGGNPWPLYRQMRVNRMRANV